MTYDVDLLPGVNHQSIRHWVFPRSMRSRCLAISSTRPTCIPTCRLRKPGNRRLSASIFTHRLEMRSLVSDDGRSAAIWLRSTRPLNYHDVSTKFRLLSTNTRMTTRSSMPPANDDPRLRVLLPARVVTISSSPTASCPHRYIFFKGRITCGHRSSPGLLSTVWGLDSF